MKMLKKTRKTVSTIAILWPVKAIFEKRAATVEVDTSISPVILSERAKGAGKASCGESVVQMLILDSPFCSLPSLQALESKVGDSKLQCHLDQWLIDGGMVSWDQLLVYIAFSWRAVLSQPLVPCSVAAFLESTACTKPDGSSVWLLIQMTVHSLQQKTSNQM